jgi:type II secretory pathway pseudopilin PulG
MNDIHPRIIRIGAGLAVLASLLAFVARSAQGQSPTVQRLSLAEAARLAAVQTASVQSAQYRVQEAQARVTQSRSSLLPVPRTPLAVNVHRSSFGFDFPTQPGQPPLLDPNGQIIGPVRLFDFRGEARRPCTIQAPPDVFEPRALR